MHINSDRLIESLTEVELMHINNCTQCASERQKLMALTISVKHIELVQPPSAVWQNLAEQLPINKQKTNRNKSFLYVIAASLMTFSIIWLLWSHNQLQQELENVLLANQLLELQLKQEKTPNFIQTKLLSEVWFIENELSNTTSVKEQVKLLKIRETLIEGMIKQQGNSDEIFI